MLRQNTTCLYGRYISGSCFSTRVQVLPRNKSGVDIHAFLPQHINTADMQLVLLLGAENSYSRADSIPYMNQTGTVCELGKYEKTSLAG